MKAKLALFVAAVLLATGCGHKKTVTVFTDGKLNVGQMSTCVFDGEALYCGNYSTTAQEIEKGRMAEVIVYIARHMKRHATKSAESGVYSVGFGSGPIAYSIWTCTYMGDADTPIKCALLKNAGSKSVQAQLKNMQYFDAVLKPLSKEHLISVCGKPQSVIEESDRPASTLIYPTNHPDTLVNFRFRTRSEPYEAVEMDLVSLERGDKVVATVWVPCVEDYSAVNTGPCIEDYSAISTVEQYVPCLK